jgi:subtilisin family serine protease
VYAEATYEPDEYGVLLRATEGRTLAATADVHAAWLEAALDDASVLYKFVRIGRTFIGYQGKFSPSLLSKIRARREVELVDRNAHVSLMATQTDPPSWGIDRVDQQRLPLDRKYTYPDTGGVGVDVYVVDTGVRISHIDFGARAQWGITVPRDTDDTDLNGHGTHVASTIAGTSYGLAKRATIFAVKILKDSGLGTVFDVTNGMEWVVESHNNRTTKKSVANMSLGSPIRNPFMDRATEAMVEAGVHAIVAAGNSDKDACRTSPARVPGAVTVGASDNADARAYYSNWGPCVDVFAPGSNITAAWPTSDYDTNTISGTSMASPHAAGLAALLLSARQYTPAELEAAIIATATYGVLSDVDATTRNALIFVPPTLA